MIGHKNVQRSYFWHIVIIGTPWPSWFIFMACRLLKILLILVTLLSRDVFALFNFSLSMAILPKDLQKLSKCFIRKKETRNTEKLKRICLDNFISHTTHSLLHRIPVLFFDGDERELQNCFQSLFLFFFSQENVKLAQVDSMSVVAWKWMPALINWKMWTPGPTSLLSCFTSRSNRSVLSNGVILHKSKDSTNQGHHPHMMCKKHVFQETSMRNFDPKRKLLVLAKKFWAPSKVFVV